MLGFPDHGIQIELGAVLLNDTILVLFYVSLEKQLRFASRSLDYLGHIGMPDSST